MLDNNVYRLIMFIGIVTVVCICINMLADSFDDIKNTISQFYTYRFKKY